MMSLSGDKQADVIDAFNTISRYLDDILSINNVYFDTMVSEIYHSELQLNKANTSNTEAAFFDLHLLISNDIVSTKNYDKRDDFDFEIVNFPFLDGDIPRTTSYGVYISQLIRLLEHLAMLLTPTLRNFLNKAIGIINFPKPFLSFIDDTMMCYLTSKLDLNLFWAKDFRNLNSMVTWCINSSRSFDLITFQRSSLKQFPIIKRLAISLMYCSRLHAWWSTQWR